MATVFLPLFFGFSWFLSSSVVGGGVFPDGETQTGSTIGVRADGDTAHSTGNYSWFVVITGPVNAESTSDFQAKLSLKPGNYWAAINQTDMLNGVRAASDWSGEIPLS